MWDAEDNRPAQATPDGRFLVFLGSAELTPGDTSRVPQLFEYDVQADRLTRVSTGVNGGNVRTFHDAPQLPVQRFSGRDLPTEAGYRLALSPDGSTVLFTSAAELAPGATSSEPSVFEYRSGSVYLISDGQDASSTIEGPAVQLYGLAAGTEPEAHDVFFTTTDQLVPQDGETQVALYDAREGGGFAAQATDFGCQGEMCRGATSIVPSLAGASSVTQAGGENVISSPAPRAKTQKDKSPNRAERLMVALKRCKQQPKRKRASCARRARKRYGATAVAKKSARGSKQS